MKACLMKVNYDPKYMTPHVSINASIQRGSLSSSNLLPRVALMRPVDSSNCSSCLSTEKKTQDQIHQRMKERLPRQATEELRSTSNNNATPSVGHATVKLPPAATHNRIFSRTTSLNVNAKEHAMGESTIPGNDPQDPKGGSQVRFMRLIGPGDSTILKPSLCRYPPALACSLQAPQRTKSNDVINKSVQLPKSVNISYPQHLNQTSALLKSPEHGHFQGSVMLSCQRSKTSLPSEGFNFKPTFQVEQERHARVEAENAMKNGKVFTVLGPYPSLRAALRRRGWVEKFQSSASGDGTVSIPKSVLAEINGSVASDNHSSNERKVDSSVLAMMSHYVRNCTPTLVFSVKAIDVVSRPMRNNQLVNHFGRASTLTTKAGLCQCLRSVQWFENVDPNMFYPRCFNLGEADEMEAFLDDYRLTACMGFVKHFLTKYKQKATDSLEDNQSSAIISSKSDNSMKMSEIVIQQENDKVDTNCLVLPEDVKAVDGVDDSHSEKANIEKTDNDCSKTVSAKALKFAIKQCQLFLAENDHDDIDVVDNRENILGSDWSYFLDNYHSFVNNEVELEGNLAVLLKSCEELLESLQEKWPQFQLDGIRDIWILKPGAKSRGRGIQCTNQLSEIMDAIATSDCALVAQKYIERPFLIYKTKFDIRQWFLVTDWNPLTMWFYNDCYLRFCSREFSLEDLHVSIHLSNNSVQKYFAPDPNRSNQLPEDNMWTSDEFIDHLRKEGLGEVWKKCVIPGMKKAILCSLLCAQDQVEPRKGSFELFGADFMLDEDLQPWLIEINSSPSMARNTHATAKLVDCVMEDTIKVVLDRKLDKTCSVGRFELAYRAQTINDPPLTDPDLSIEGRKIKHKISRKSP